MIGSVVIVVRSIAGWFTSKPIPFLSHISPHPPSFLFTHSNVHIEHGYLYVEDDVEVGGDLTVEGTSELKKKVTIKDDLKVEDDLHVDGHTTLSGDVEAQATLQVRNEISTKQYRVSASDYGLGSPFSTITFGSFVGGCDASTINGVVISGGIITPELSANNVDALGGEVCADLVTA